MDLHRINLNLLVALDALLSEQNVTAAAKKLYITQSALSNNLQQLREIFKDDLLIREKNHMVLTSFAKELQPKLHHALKKLGSLVVSAESFQPQISKREFRIGMNDYIASLLLPRLMKFLQKNAPSIKISVISTAHMANIQSMENSEYDFLIGITLSMNQLKNQLLFVDQAVCILNLRHPLAKKERITIKDYFSCKHIANSAVANKAALNILDESCAKLGLQRDTELNLPFSIPAFKIIEQSDKLIATILKSSACFYKSNFHYVTKALPFKIRPIKCLIAWHHQNENDQGHRWLREQLIQIGKKIQQEIN